MILTGFGASIGSVPPDENVNCVANVTFRNIQMPYTGNSRNLESLLNALKEREFMSSQTQIVTHLQLMASFPTSPIKI